MHQLMIYLSNMAVFQKKQKKTKKIYNRKLKCSLCKNGISNISYLDVYRLKRFTSRKGKIISRFRSGNCAKHQRQVTSSIKRARVLSLMPYLIKD